jgi:hypothetical protein
MNFTDHGREYRLTRASDTARDGMRMELAVAGESKVLAEIFYSDATRDFTLSVFEQNLPLSVIERLIGSAKIGLPPATKLYER